MIARLIPFLMAFLLVAAPSHVFSGPLVAKANMPCCGHSCGCAPGKKMCTVSVTRLADRAVAQTRPEISGRAAVPLYALDSERTLFSVKAGAVATVDEKPPPLVRSDFSQAELRVWIL